ncbi:Trypsin-like peptidase domain-containing protein [Parelusimicrobium proximum]|uniref:S1 family peptidase n=1 Tax=Parelusimicrobium proximum TaxID=3228953 RepID=UPI003D17B43B
MAHPLSSVPFLIDIYFNDTKLAVGTAFLYKKDGKPYLVTNKHNATGKNIFTDNYISTNLSIPNIWKFDYRCFEKIDNGQILIQPKRFEVKLVHDEDTPLYWMHQTKNVDIVVFPLPADIFIKDNTMVESAGNAVFINSLPFNSEMLTQVSDDVFIIGFPNGKTSTLAKLPIWKRGTIASEPDMSYFGDDRQAFLIDTTTRSGMSGSPVVAIQGNAVKMKNGTIIMGGVINIDFLGIYSGRIDGDQKEDSYIGLVWRKELIDEIIDSNLSV